MQWQSASIFGYPVFNYYFVYYVLRIMYLVAKSLESLSGPAVTFKLLRLTHRPTGYVHFKSLLPSQFQVKVPRVQCFSLL